MLIDKGQAKQKGSSMHINYIIIQGVIILFIIIISIMNNNNN